LGAAVPAGGLYNRLHSLHQLEQLPSHLATTSMHLLDDKENIGKTLENVPAPLYFPAHLYLLAC
jgi:hypothetical protein